MVAVPVGDDHVIELLESRDLGDDVADSFRIPHARIARVDENGFIFRRDDQGGAAAFDIDPVDVERFVLFAGEKRRRWQEGEQRNEKTAKGNLILHEEFV